MSAQTLQPWNEVKWKRTVSQVCPWGVRKRIAGLSCSKKSSLPDRFFLPSLKSYQPAYVLNLSRRLSGPQKLFSALARPFLKVYSFLRTFQSPVLPENGSPASTLRADCLTSKIVLLFLPVVGIYHHHHHHQLPSRAGHLPWSSVDVTLCLTMTRCLFCALGEVSGFSPSALCGKYQLLINFFHTDWWGCLAKASNRDSTTHSHNSVVMMG